jgi:hypothetical protein
MHPDPTPSSQHADTVAGGRHVTAEPPAVERPSAAAGRAHGHIRIGYSPKRQQWSAGRSPNSARATDPRGGWRTDWSNSVN